MHISDSRWQMSPGHCRVDGFGLVNLKDDKPIFLNVVVSEKPRERCSECFFNQPFYNSGMVCKSLICHRRSRFDHQSVHYTELNVDKKEMCRLTRLNYLRWIKRRHYYPDYFIPFIESFKNGEQEVHSDIGNYRFTEKSILKIRPYIAMSESDQEYLQVIKEYPLIYWEDKLYSNSWEDYPVMITRKEIVKNMEKIDE